MQGLAYIPALAPAFTPSHTPAPSAMLQFLLAALRFGDARSWLGQDAMSRIEKSGDPSLLSRLTSDFSGLARAARSSADPLRTEYQQPR